MLKHSVFLVRAENKRHCAPIPHAELLTLAELAEKAKVELPTARARLRTAGITNFTDGSIMAKLAEQHRASGQRLFQIIDCCALPP